MRRWSRAIAAGVVSSIALAPAALTPAQTARAVEPVVASTEASGGMESAAFIDAEQHFTFNLDNEDATLSPPLAAYVTEDSPFVHPDASPAVPLPPALWTGLAGLAGLGSLSLLRRLRRAR